VMITLSVLFLKVHYIIDVLVAIALTEIVAWFIEKYPYLSEKLNKGITYVNRKLHLETK
jgi:membrane-associated phospholipid phosphatase